MDGDEYQETEMGTPQGSLISPMLANITLAGLENWILKQEFRKVKSKNIGGRRVRLEPKVNVIRYADDFVITARTREIAEQALEASDVYLKERGLKLNREKTKITKVTEGFDILGYHVRVWPSGLKICPSKNSMNSIREKIRVVLEDENANPAAVVKELNPILRGWTNYFRVASSTAAFVQLGHYIWQATFKWLTRKYPTTGKRTLYKAYYRRVGTGRVRALMFCPPILDQRTEMKDNRYPVLNVAGVKMVSLIKRSIKLDLNPYDLTTRKYFEERRRELAQKMLDTQAQHHRLFKMQGGLCPICNEELQENQR